MSLVEAIEDALKQMADGAWYQLARSPLQESKLVVNQLWQQEEASLPRRAAVLEWVLRWAVSQLRPAGEPDWNTTQGRRYLLLDLLYCTEKRLDVKQVAIQVSISESTLYDVRSAALKQLAQIWEDADNLNCRDYVLAQRLQDVPDVCSAALKQLAQILEDADNPDCHDHILAQRLQDISDVRSVLKQLAQILEDADNPDCHDHILAQRLQDVPVETDPLQLLYTLSLTQRPLSASELPHLWAQINDMPLAELLTPLVDNHLLQFDISAATVTLQPALHMYLYKQAQTHRDKATYHGYLAKHFATRQELATIAHWSAANEHAQAAQWALNHADALIAAGEGSALQTALVDLVKQVSAEYQGQLYYLLGQLAYHDKALATAQRYYEQARGDAAVWSQACYQLARVLQQRGLLDEALRWFTAVADKLAETQADNQLLVAAYLGIVLIYAQERNDLAQAETYLQRAKEILSPTDRSAWAQWHDLRGTVLSKQGKFAEAVPHHLEAYIAASEIGDTLLVLRNAHNLGMAYTYAKRLDEGTIYLQKALTLAQTQENQQRIGQCYKTIGANHFFRGDDDEAIAAYRIAYEIFKQLKNDNWLTAVSYDLLEVYARMGDVDGVTFFLNETRTLAQRAGITRLQVDVQKLMRCYPLMFIDELGLSERQVRGIQFTKAAGQMSKQEYMQINEIGPKMAQRDLKRLVEKEILRQEGRGRGIRYFLQCQDL